MRPIEPSAWLRISNITDKVTGVFLTDDVELRTERLEPLYRLQSIQPKVTTRKHKEDAQKSLLIYDLRALARVRACRRMLQITAFKHSRIDRYLLNLPQPELARYTFSDYDYATVPPSASVTKNPKILLFTLA